MNSWNSCEQAQRSIHKSFNFSPLFKTIQAAKQADPTVIRQKYLKNVSQQNPQQNGGKQEPKISSEIPPQSTLIRYLLAASLIQQKRWNNAEPIIHIKPLIKNTTMGHLET
ncbi:unnamed protein product [Paramecium octaurelia]|uniref:Uncharacterized protein n=1 Tax=Paramecium octaurelia TaxID=43137 RepID=A0A8S1W8S9_PAROT|nr:unnamed protein product [Paramecium octaurelia]